MIAAAEKVNVAPLIRLAREAMILIARRRAIVDAPIGLPAIERIRMISVCAIDLRAYLRGAGFAGDTRWSGVVFTAPRGVWWRVGYIPNPERHGSPTPCFVVNEPRAQALGL